MDDVWHNSKVLGNDRLLLLAIADNADEEKRIAWPSVDTLSRKTRIPRRTIFRCIKRLVKAGELEIVEHGRREGHSNTYRVLVEKYERKAGGGVKVAPVPPNGTPPVPKLGIPGVPQLGTLTVSEPSTNRGRSPRSILDLKDIINAKKELSDGLKAKFSSETANGRKWSNEDARARYVQLKKESSEITEKIAMMA